MLSNHPAVKSLFFCKGIYLVETPLLHFEHAGVNDKIWFHGVERLKI